MRILIVGSLSEELGKAAKIMIANDCLVDHAENIHDALKKICEHGDYKFSFCSCLGDLDFFIKSIRSERILLPIFACGPEDKVAAVCAIASGAEDYISLPPDPDIIAAFIENFSQKEQKILFLDPVMRAFMENVDKICKTDASILITGESGTGKELLSHYIHSQSNRKKQPFIALNCAALPENLVESELFGHEKGAFSGAVSRRIGRFEAANNGTLLLDEISEMNVHLQAKLLRAIQEKEIDRLGGNRPVPVNVRIIATSNRDMPTEIEKGNFRQDLYFRLNVINLHIPPLRKRTKDIRYLSNYFLDKYSILNGLSMPKISEKSFQILEEYYWPGNIRELENLIHRAIILSPESKIDDKFFDCLNEKNKEKSFNSESIWVGYKVSEIERALIIDTLRYTDGNRTRAASILGISIRALRNKLKEYMDSGVSIPCSANRV